MLSQGDGASRLMSISEILLWIYGGNFPGLSCVSGQIVTESVIIKCPN